MSANTPADVPPGVVTPTSTVPAAPAGEVATQESINTAFGVGRVTRYAFQRAAERPRKVPTETPSLGAAAPRTMLWRIERAEGESFEVPVPKERGRYVLSVMKIAESGEVGAASVAFSVQ